MGFLCGPVCVCVSESVSVPCAFPLAPFLLFICFALFWFVCCLFIFYPILLFLDPFLDSNERKWGGEEWGFRWVGK